MIDTHVHLNDDHFEHIIDETIKRAHENGINKMIIVGYDKKTSLKAVKIAHEYDNIYASVGLHPSEVSKDNSDLDWLIELLNDDKVIAIGEIGLDYHWDTSNKDLQKKYFIMQINIANEYKMPIIIHNRDACKDTLEIVKKYANIKGIMHCFSGSIEIAHKYMKLGFLLGIGGVVTFKNSNLREVVKEIPLDYMVSETDSPYLAPTPYRGKPNEPKNIRLIIEEISHIKNVTIEEIEKRMEENVYQLFGI